jgi:hypothetical protein
MLRPASAARTIVVVAGAAGRTDFGLALFPTVMAMATTATTATAPNANPLKPDAHPMVGLSLVPLGREKVVKTTGATTTATSATTTTTQPCARLPSTTTTTGVKTTTTGAIITTSVLPRR